MINHIKTSIQLALYNFADWLTVPSVTKQAFSKARNKLSPLVFQLLSAKLTEEFYSDNIIKRFKGLRVFAIDSSVLRLPSSPELYEKYGCDSYSNSVPLARASVMFDVLNNLTLHASINPYNASERDLALEHIEKTNTSKPFEDLLIFDRGYPSIFLLFFLNVKKKHFLMRIPETFLVEIRAAVKSGSHDLVISIPARGNDHPENFKRYLPDFNRDETLLIRVLVFNLSSGQKEVVITSLLDQNEFSYDDIFALYGMRWNVEENYKFYKVIAEIENFSGKSKLAIEQDFYATVFSCNISALLMQEAQDELTEKAEDKLLQYEYKINRNILVGIVKNEILEVFLGNQDLDAYCETLKNRIKKNLVPVRPNRKFPRTFKRGKNTINRRAL